MSPVSLLILSKLTLPSFNWSSSLKFVRSVELFKKKFSFIDFIVFYSLFCLYLIFITLDLSQKAKKTEHGTTDWFQVGKGVHQGCILSPCLFKLYAEYIMQNAKLDKAQAGIKIARRNINNLR